VDAFVGGDFFLPRTKFSKSRVVSSIGPSDELSCSGDVAPLEIVEPCPISCNFCVCCWITLFSISRMTASNRLN
jgi:hypothetical protein